MDGGLVLVTGGVRSGKSAFAERLAARWGPGVLYVATAAAGDAEMAARIAAHRARRPPSWSTLAEPLEPARAIAASGRRPGVALLDCLTLLVANVLLAEGAQGDPAVRLQRITDELIALAAPDGWRLVVVTSEVGLGGIAASPLGRRYADLLGDANQRLAAAAARVYCVLAGLAVEWSQLAVRPDELA